MKKRRAETRRGMVVTTVAFDRALHKRLAFAAIGENAALTEIVRLAVRAWLDRRERRTRGRTRT